MFGHNNPPSRGPPPNHPMHHQPPPNMSGMGQSHGPPPNIVNQPPPPVHSNVVHAPVHPSGVPPPSHVPFVGGERVVDWIEQIKKDYLTLEQEYLQCKHHRDELERKLESQISEFQLMHTAIYDLENGFTAAKQHYEDRIQQLNATVIELKQQLGQQQQQDNSHYPVPNGQVPPSQYLNAPSQQMHMGRDNFGGNPSGLSTLPPPNLQNPSSQSLPSMMSNQPPSNLSQTLNGSSPPLPPIGVNSGNPQVNNGGMGGNHLPPYPHDGYQQQGNKPPQQSGGGSRASPFPGNGPALNNPPPNNEMLMPMHNVPPNGSTLPSIQPPKQNGNIPINTSSVGPTPVNTNVSQATQHIIERPKSVNNSQIHNPPQQTNGNPNLQQSAQTNGILPPQQTTNQVNLFDQRGNENVVKKEGNDWVVVYNPQVTATTNLNMSLYHNLDQESVVCCVKFSSCGRYLATGSNKQAIVFDVDTGKKFGTFSTIGPVGSSVQHEDDEREEQQSKKPSSNDQDEVIEGGMKEDSYIRSVCFSPDSKYLVAGADDKTVKIWDVESKQIYRSLEGHELDIYSLDFSPDSRFLVSGSGDGKAKIWDMDSGECRHTCGNEEIGPREGVTSVAISPDGKTVATGSLDCVVRLWDMATGDLIEAFSGNGGHDDSVYSVAFSPDGKTLASGSLDRTLKIWDIKSASCIASLSGHRDFVLSVAYSPDGKWLVSGSKDRSVQFWDPRSNVLHLMLQGHKNSVISVSLNPKRPLFATGSGDFRARVWRYE